MPTPNRAAKRASEIKRPGSAPDQPKRGRPNTPQTPAIEKEIREVQRALDDQIKQRNGLTRSIETKTAALQKMVAAAEKKALDRKAQMRELHGVDESINKKITRLKELNVDRSRDRRQPDDESMMDVNYILSDGSVGVVQIDVNGGVIFNSD